MTADCEREWLCMYGPFCLVETPDLVMYIREESVGEPGYAWADVPCLVSCDQEEFDTTKAEETWGFTL